MSAKLAANCRVCLWLHMLVVYLFLVHFQALVWGWDSCIGHAAEMLCLAGVKMATFARASEPQTPRAAAMQAVFPTTVKFYASRLQTSVS
jgi:hypothetical protein